MIISVYISYHIEFGGSPKQFAFRANSRGIRIVLHQCYSTTQSFYIIFFISIFPLSHTLSSSLLIAFLCGMEYSALYIAFHIFMMCVCCTAAPCFVTLAQISYMYENTERYEVNNRKMEVRLPLLNSMLFLRKKGLQLFTLKGS